MARRRYISRVVNADLAAGAAKLNGSGAPADAVRLFLRSQSRLLETRPGTSKLVGDLGGLCALILDLASVRNHTAKLLAGKETLKPDALGDRVWSFDWRAVKLVGDGNGDLHIAGFYRPLPDGLERGRTYFLGSVVRLVRRTTNGAEIPHPFAPHGGEYPRLYYRDGFLFFRGGTYSITGKGIEG